MIINATQYSHLVGKWVIMSRLSTLEELAATDGEQVVGAEGYVSGVIDEGTSRVRVIFAHRETWLITGNDAPDWRFEIWVNARAYSDWKQVAE